MDFGLGRARGALKKGQGSQELVFGTFLAPRSIMAGVGVDTVQMSTAWFYAIDTRDESLIDRGIFAELVRKEKGSSVRLAPKESCSPTLLYLSISMEE